MTPFACMYVSDYKPTLGETDFTFLIDRPKKKPSLMVLNKVDS